MHPYCRSSVLPVLETEDDLDRELEEMMRQAGAPEGMTFDEFVEHLEPSEDGERLEYKAEPLEGTEPKTEQNEEKSTEPVDNSQESGIIKHREDEEYIFED